MDGNYNSSNFSVCSEFYQIKCEKNSKFDLHFKLLFAQSPEIFSFMASKDTFPLFRPLDRHTLYAT